jgi:glycosyltransferase involved in cell wall biosynthesis
MHVLFLSRWYPYPPDNGSRIRVFNLLKHLAARHTVDLISFTEAPLADEQREAMQAICRRVVPVPYRPFQPRRWKALLGFFSALPRSVIDTHNAEMQRQVERVGRQDEVDVVIASEIDMAPYALAVPGVPRIFEDLELTVLYENYIKQRDLLQKARRGLGWWKISRYAAGLLRAFDGCTVVSGGERARIESILPGYQPVAEIPNGVDVAHHVGAFGAPEPDTLIYSGALTYQANFDAMDYFLREVFPLIRAEWPNAEIAITGKLSGVPMDRLPDCKGVIFTGYLDDIRPAVARSWVSVVPLREGGGTRLKVLEALALGTPVVATRKGAEGLDLVPGRDLLIADDPADFAAAVVHVLRDPALRATLSRNGREAVEGVYDWHMIGQRFCDFVERVASKADAPVRLQG